MRKKLIFLSLLVLCLFWLVMDHTSFASDTEKMKAIPIPAERIVPPFHPFTTSGERACVIQYDNGSATYYFPNFDTGWGFAVYMDPQVCVAPNPYPFKLTNVHLCLFDFLNAVWNVEIRVNIRNLQKDTVCLGPSTPTPLYHQTFTIPIDSSYDSLGRPMNLDLDSLTNPNSTCCLNDSFFLEIIFTGGTSAPFPSLLMTETTDSADTCHDWFLFDGTYHEWYGAWTPPTPGNAIIRTIGYSHSLDCYSCWHWIPTKTTAPSGMPDFDQYQFRDSLANDSSALDVPTAVANCLWWFDAVPKDTTPSDLIRLLSTYLGTEPDSGTSVDSLQIGLGRYLTHYGFDLFEHTYIQPDFKEMADSLEKSQNIILILGFWQFDGESWHRFGGHATTLAGVCSESSWVAFSDPAVDGAELGWQGRFFPLGHPPHPDNDTLHNDSIYVSHDIYASDTLFLNYGDSLDTLWRIKDFYEKDTSLFRKFEGQNFQPGQMQYFHSYEPSESVYTAVEYAIMICPKSTAVEDEEEVITPKDFELFQNHPNPFNPSTKIEFRVQSLEFREPRHTTLKIYNILGQKVRTLVDEPKRPGSYEVIWDGKDEEGKDLSSGIYFYQLKLGEITQTKRMILLK